MTFSSDPPGTVWSWVPKGIQSAASVFRLLLRKRVQEREKGEWVLESILEELPDDVTAKTELVPREPARTFLQYADEHEVGVIVIGSHGREGTARVLLGSIAETVVLRVAVGVTEVRAEELPNG